ncbi:MAG: hypothetical protein KatS3mg020_1017 [Fimbriimonadales bacterium]|nr:MAG: hypothetical protein KatS3mg020_1017 [Fimbriimonadales bacterium]
MLDERLERSVRLQEPSITLGLLGEAIQKQSGVLIRVARAWREARIIVYTPDTPLRDLMAALTEALPMLEWRALRSASDEPPVYQLQARRPAPSRPAERTPAQQLQTIRAILHAARRLTQQTPHELITRYRREWERLPHTERSALAIALALKDAYPNALSHEQRRSLEAYGKTGYEFRRDLYFPLLMRLRDTEWNELAQRGFCLRRLSNLSEGAKLRATLQQYLQAQLSGQAWHDLLLCFYYGAFTFRSDFVVWARPIVNGRVQPSTVALEAPPAGVTPIDLAVRAPTPAAELQQEALMRERWEQRAPDLPRAWRLLRLPTSPPEWLKAKANWYNHYACFLLECATQAQTPMIGAFFPFVGLSSRSRGFEQAFQRASARDAQALASLLQTGLYEPREQNGWIILRHITPWSARQDDYGDDALSRMLPMPPPTGAPFLDAAALRQQTRFAYQGVGTLVLPFYPFRLHEMTPYQSPYHDAFEIGARAKVVSPRVAWEFYLNLTPQQQARFKAGGKMLFHELNGPQQQRFLALLIGNVAPHGWTPKSQLGDLLLSNLSFREPPAARLRVERQREVIREPNPDARTRILQSENQFYALMNYLKHQESQSVERERLAERWLLELRWDNITVAWELTERTPSIDWLWAE